MSDQEKQQDVTLLDKVVDAYETNPVLRVLVALNPKAKVAEIGALSIYRLWQRRMDLFGHELIMLNIHPAEDRIKEREFLDAFMLTGRVVQQTSNDEKIKRFARLFASLYDRSFAFSSFDEYEEFVSILDEISEREFTLLLTLHRYETDIPLEGRNPLQRAIAFWNSFKTEVQKASGIPAEELTAMLTRLQRTGLYEHFVGGYGDYAGGMGNLTPLFPRFIRALKIHS